MREIPLTQGKVALVDDEDYEELVQCRWYAHKEGNSWYACRHTPRVSGKREFAHMHREIMGAEPGQEVDHVDGEGLNNQRANLRLCTREENGRNQHHKTIGCTSQYKGISWSEECRKWRAQIRFEHRLVHLGYFDLEADAARAYNAAAAQHFGEFARPNVIG